MKYGKLLTVFVIILLISLVAGSRHFAATRSKHFTVMTANPPLSPMPSGTQAKAPGTEEVDPQAVTDKVANFLGPPQGEPRKPRATSAPMLFPTRSTLFARRLRPRLPKKVCRINNSKRNRASGFPIYSTARRLWENTTRRSPA